jgi:hypothetical protein
VGFLTYLRSSRIIGKLKIITKDRISDICKNIILGITRRLMGWPRDRTSNPGRPYFETLLLYIISNSKGMHIFLNTSYYDGTISMFLVTNLVMHKSNIGLCVNFNFWISNLDDEN